MLSSNGFDWIIKDDKVVVHMRSHWGTVSFHVMSPKAFSNVILSGRYKKVKEQHEVITTIFETPIQDMGS